MTVPTTRIIGVDPGPIPGFCVIDVWARLGGDSQQIRGVHVEQVSAGDAIGTLNLLLDQADAWDFATVFQIEKFVVGRRTTRSKDARAGATTRNMVGELSAVYTLRRPGTPLYELSASAVKPWATDARLARAGLLEASKGKRHARDGCRHALYAAVRSGTLRDPLGWQSL